MKILYVLTAISLSIAISISAQAQKPQGTVKGTLQDSISGQNLYDATVSVVRVSDSTLISFTLSSNSGFFEVKSMPPGEYRVVVSYQGFRTLKKIFTITPEAPVADLGIIKMDRSYNTLGEVVVTDEAPVKIKGDTIAYNANSFKTKPNAVVEDLLKKLPGVTVDKDGTVKAQGETVQKVYVDGKEFFGTDPKLATKNLGADMISEVEVFDDMSDQAKFNRIDDGSRSKAINLKLKKEKKHGTFGQVSAGYGTDDRFTANTRLNFFKGATQFAIIGNGNNLNRQTFTGTDFLGMSGLGGGSFGGGGGQMMMGGGGRGGGGMTMSVGGSSMGGGNMQGGGSTGGSGISTIASAGINYSDTWNKFFDANSAYNFNHTSTDNIRNSYRKTFLGDSNINRNQDQFSRSITDAHRANIRVNYTIDSYNSLIYTSNVTTQNSSSFRNDTVTSFTEKMNSMYKLSESRSRIDNTGDGVNWNNNVLWRRRFDKAGRTLSVNLSHFLGRNNIDGFNNSVLSDYEPGGVKIRDSIFNQNNKRKSTNDNYGVSMSYTEPIGRDKIWEFNYGYNRNASKSDRETYDYDPITRKYSSLNDALTNHFDNLNQLHRIGSNFRVIKKRYNYQLGLTAQRTLMESDDLSEKLSFDEKYTNLLTNASFQYQFARTKNLRFNYRGRTNQPTISQLQPLRDVSNPTYITEGNPDLKQEFSNNFNLNYTVFDPIRFRNLFANLTFSNTYNKIVNSTEQLPFGRQLTKPVNIDGTYSIGANVNAGIPLKGLNGSNLNATTLVNFNRNANLVNGRKNYIKNLTIGEDLRLSYNYKEKLDLGVTAGISYTSARYSIQPQQNNSFYTHSYSLDATYVFKGGLLIATDVDFTANTGRSDGFNQSFTMWNASIGQQLFKNKRGEIKLSVNDILNQNISINRNVGDNYVEDVQTNVIKRFFMLSFIYNINRMAGKSIPGQGRGGNVERIITN